MAGDKNIGQYQGRRVLITGGTSGLGLELVKLLLREDYIVCATGRKFNSGSIANDRFYFVKADFSVFSEVADAVNKITEMIGVPDIIINNAGILSPPDFTLSDDGFELSFQVNLLSHLLLNEQFIRQPGSDKRLMVVSVTSPVYRYARPEYLLPVKENYSPFKVYAESKYYLLTLGKYLMGKYPEKDLDFIGFNPGTFRSGIYRMQKKYFQTLYRIAAPFMRSPGRVAENLVKIIKSRSQSEELVYRSLSNSEPFKDTNGEKSVQFLNDCAEIVSGYLK